MPTGFRPIPAHMIETLSVYRSGYAQDSEGNITGTETLIGSVTGCVQPWDGEVTRAQTSQIENAQQVTHIAFFQTRMIGGPVSKDTLRAEDGTNYEIEFVHNFGTSPQQLDLRIATDQD